MNVRRITEIVVLAGIITITVSLLLGRQTLQHLHLYCLYKA